MPGIHMVKHAKLTLGGYDISAPRLLLGSIIDLFHFVLILK